MIYTIACYVAPISLGLLIVSFFYNDTYNNKGVKFQPYGTNTAIFSVLLLASIIIIGIQN